MWSALLGTGGIGSHLAREVRSHPDGEPAALVDVDPSSLASTGEAFDVLRANRFEDEDSMYAGTDGLDVVIISTPPAFHYAVRSNARSSEAFTRSKRNRS